MREGEYTSQVNGAAKRVQFTDGDVLRDVADLYSVVQGEFKGTPSIESEQLKSMLGNLQGGAPLSGAEFEELARIRKRYAEELATFRSGPDNDSEGFVPAGNPGAGRVTEAARYAGLMPCLREAEADKAPSTTTQDKNATGPHLLDTVVHDLGHAILHSQRLFDKDVKADPQSQQFNAEHSTKHLLSALEHAKKLDAHLKKERSDPKAWAKERDALNAMREGASTPPPHLRQSPPHSEAAEGAASTPNPECGTCMMFDHGYCWGYGNFPVHEDWLCDSWSADPDWRQQDEEADAAAGKELAPMAEDSAPVITPAANDVKQTVCVDFDGVIHIGGHGMPGEVEGDPADGVAKGLKSLADLYRVVILTARQDLTAVRNWLSSHGLAKYVDEVTNVKPPAVAYIDDRAVHFTNWAEAVKATDPSVVTTQPIVQMKEALTYWKLLREYSDDQPRDDHGRWAAGGGGSAASTNQGAGYAHLLANGQHVEIPASSLPGVVEAMKSSGEPINMENLHVDGLDQGHMFDSSATDLTRAQMPQLPGDPKTVEEFRQQLAAQGIEAHMEMRSPLDLYATQTQLDGGKVGGILDWIKSDPAAAQQGALFASKDGAILDGHHRWGAGVVYAATQDSNFKFPVLVANADIHPLLNAAYAYDTSHGIASQTWDHPAVAGAMGTVQESARRMREADARDQPFVRPPGPPPDETHPWLWFGGRWIQLVTDTADGVPKQLDHLPPKVHKVKESGPRDGDVLESLGLFRVREYSPDQPRDEHGRFSGGGGGDMTHEPGAFRVGGAKVATLPEDYVVHELHGGLGDVAAKHAADYVGRLDPTRTTDAHLTIDHAKGTATLTKGGVPQWTYSDGKLGSGDTRDTKYLPGHITADTALSDSKAKAALWADNTLGMAAGWGLKSADSGGMTDQQAKSALWAANTGPLAGS